MKYGRPEIVCLGNATAAIHSSISKMHQIVLDSEQTVIVPPRPATTAAYESDE
jgi:hypothetical protein